LIVYSRLRTQDGEPSLEQFVMIRTEWQHFISTLGPTSALTAEEIDPKAS